VAYFMVDKRRGVGWEPERVEMTQRVEHLVEISRPHVLGGVDAKPGHSAVYQLVQVADDALSHPASITLQVSQTDQSTVANLHSVVVILQTHAQTPLVMVALWNRADHYIFILFLSSFFISSPIISAVGDWMSTILPHMVWP